MRNPITSMLQIGQKLPLESIKTIMNKDIALAHGSGLIHIQMRRFSGCPLCNVHLVLLAERMTEIAAKGIIEVVVFRTSDVIIKENQGSVEWAKDLNFFGDEEGKLYKLFGIENKGMMGYMNLKAIKLGLSGMKYVKGYRKFGKKVYNCPMDILVDSSTGTIVALKYGTTVYDQWSVDELLSLVK